MFLLSFGVFLCIAAHLVKRIAPGAYARAGLAGRVAALAVLILSAVMMVIGYRSADGTVYWGPHPHAVRLNNLLMLLAIYCFAAAGMKTALSRHLPNLMFWGVVIWAVAHLLVNGDTPSFVLFGTLGLWCLIEIAVSARNRSVWTPPPPRPPRFEWMALGGTIAVFFAAVSVHYLMGYAVLG